MRQLNRGQTPLVDRTLGKKVSVQRTRLARVWGLVNMVMAIIMYFEITYESLAHYFGVEGTFAWYLGCFLAALFTFNAFVDFMYYLGSSLSAAVIELTPKQKVLLGVKDSDKGFRTAQPRPYTGDTSGLRFSPGSYGSHSTLSGSTTPISGQYASPDYSPRHTPPGVLTFSPSPRHPSRSPSPHGSYGSQSQSFLQNSSFLDHSYGGGSGHVSFSGSFTRSGTASPLSPTSTLSPLFKDASLDASGLRSRLHNVSARSSPLRPDDQISDLKGLEQYLKEQEEKDYRNQIGGGDTSPNGGQSFWNYNRTITDYTPVLRKYQYQIACRSPRSTKSTDNDPDDQATYRGEEIWARVGVLPEEVEHWKENLRKWLSQTIMVRLLEEINKINNTLDRMGSKDMQIGEVSISTLKQLAVTKGQHVPSLNTLIPFLEVSSNQEYLVARIRDLGPGGVMSDFKWNGGGEFKSKPWNEHLPTDCELVMHMLCCYMDSRLPPHPKYPDGKTFTSQHFMKTPDKPDLKNPENVLIYQSKINPPHFKVILGDDTWDLPRGRNNLFHAILLFLHHIKVKQNGMLGRVNLGMSGINALWVLE